MNFNDSGRFSQWWWLDLIKRFGSEGAAKFVIAENGITSYQNVKEAIDHLVLSGYAKMEGKGGRAGYQYRLTILGHRYLEEHKDDDPTGAGPELPAEEVVAPRRQDSPMTLVSQAVIGTNLTARIHKAPAEPELVAQPAAGGGSDPIEEPKQITTLPKNSVTMPLSAINITTVAQVRHALADILIERFAKKVTAEELLARLERTDP